MRVSTCYKDLELSKRRHISKTYLRLRRIYKFGLSAEGHAALLDADVTIGCQRGLVGWFVLPVQVKGEIDLVCSSLLRLR